MRKAFIEASMINNSERSPLRRILRGTLTLSIAKDNDQYSSILLQYQIDYESDFEEAQRQTNVLNTDVCIRCSEDHERD